MSNFENLAHLCSILNTVCERQKIGCFVIGRTARDLHLERCARLGRPINPVSLVATYDIDCALMVPDWNAFKNLRNALLSESSEHFQETGSPQRLLYHGPGGALPLDLVPAGGVEDSQAKIYWPPDANPCLSVAGFKEAYDDALTMDFGPTRIRFASAAGLALLKLFAWNDRRDRTDDIDDLALLIRCYEKIAGEDRLYTGVDSDLMQIDRFDTMFVWARILGRDIGRMTKLRATAGRLKEILDREASDPFDLATLLQKFTPCNFDRALDTLTNLSQGFHESLSHEISGEL